MPTTKNAPTETEKLRLVLRHHARLLLEESPVISVTEFESQLLEAVPAAKELDDVLQSGRKRNLNLVDWVKSDLTRAEVLHYVGHDDDRLMVYLPVAGQVNGEVLSSHAHAVRIIKGLAEKWDD